MAPPPACQGSRPRANHREDRCRPEAGEAWLGADAAARRQLPLAVGASPGFPAPTLRCARRTQEQANGHQPSHPQAEASQACARAPRPRALVKPNPGFGGPVALSVFAECGGLARGRSTRCPGAASLHPPGSAGRAVSKPEARPRREGKHPSGPEADASLSDLLPVRAVCPRPALDHLPLLRRGGHQHGRPWPHTEDSD